MMEKEIFIIRHGETDFNKMGRVQGQMMDEPINATGREQASAFYKMYGQEGFDFIYTSRLIRTKQTVAPFLTGDIPVKSMYELDEFSWGWFEGQRFEEFGDEYTRLVAAWKSGDYAAAPPLGDAPARVAKRLERAWAAIQANPAQKILVCTHGRAMRLLMCIIFDKAYAEMDSFPHENLSLYRIKLQAGQVRLVAANDRTHLLAD